MVKAAQLVLASLLQAFNVIHSERLWVERLRRKVLFLWVDGLTIRSVIPAPIASGQFHLHHESWPASQ